MNQINSKTIGNRNRDTVPEHVWVMEHSEKINCRAHIILMRSITADSCLLTVLACRTSSVKCWICCSLDTIIYAQPGCPTLVGQMWEHHAMPECSNHHGEAHKDLVICAQQLNFFSVMYHHSNILAHNLCFYYFLVLLNWVFWDGLPLKTNFLDMNTRTIYTSEPGATFHHFGTWFGLICCNSSLGILAGSSSLIQSQHTSL